MKYRPEIDGLRAIAILSVIFFHAGFSAFSGGFVGVDVFFVISGYLITRIIVIELSDEKFSLLNFYERRARRILPVLFVAMAVCSIAGYFLLMPDEFKNFGQSLVATSVFSNNLLLALTTGYWDLAGHFKPLLHTWSLAVEEQFYMIFPVLLLLSWRYARSSIRGIIITFFLSSFILALWLVLKSPTWAFYSFPTRAWELLAGALLAIFSNTFVKLNIYLLWKELLSWAGLLMILLPIFLFNQNVSTPGPLLLIPVFGTVLILAFAHQDPGVRSLLASRLFVFVGLLSYSLYIWHQPVLAFVRAFSKEEPDLMLVGISLCLVFFLSTASWKFVERPFRSSDIIGRNALFALSIIASAAFVMLGLYLDTTYGMMGRVYEEGVRIEDMDKRIYNSRVFALKKDEFLNDGRTNILIIGNSFARAFVNITTETFDISKVNIVYRDDLYQCIYPFKDSRHETLFSNADIIVFASGKVDPGCIENDIHFANREGKKIFFAGTKNFGVNLNWIIRLDRDGRNRCSRFI